MAYGQNASSSDALNQTINFMLKTNTSTMQISLIRNTNVSPDRMSHLGKLLLVTSQSTTSVLGFKFDPAFGQTNSVVEPMNCE